jgi:hypothetical protein
VDFPPLLPAPVRLFSTRQTATGMMVGLLIYFGHRAGRKCAEQRAVVTFSAALSTFLGISF